MTIIRNAGSLGSSHNGTATAASILDASGTNDRFSFENERGFTEFHPSHLEGLLQLRASDPAASGLTRTINSTVRLKDQSRTGTARQMQPGRCYLFAGVSDKVTASTVGSVQHVTMRIKFAATDQEILTLQNSTATAVTVAGGVLTFGGSLTGSNIYVDGVSKTAAQAGALLNDLEWHRLDFDLAAVSASSLVIGSDSSGFGNFYLHDFRMYSDTLTAGEVSTINDLDLGVTNLGPTDPLVWYKCEEGGTYATAIDCSGNNKDGTITAAAIASFQDETANDQYSFQNEVGYTDDTGTSGAYLPRDESDTANDTDGSALEFSGQCPHDPLILSPCVTLDGTADVVTYGSTGVSVTEIKLWVRLITDNQEILTLQNAATHAISVVAGTLTYGGSLTVSATDIDGTDYTSNLAGAGALLNDNAWHELTVTLSAVTASNLKVGTTDGVAFGNISYCHLRLNTTALVSPAIEGAGRVAHDTSGNKKHGLGTFASESAAWANQQSVYDSATSNGFGRATRLTELEYYSRSRLTSGTLSTVSAAVWFNISNTSLLYQDLVLEFTSAATGGWYTQLNAGKFEVVLVQTPTWSVYKQYRGAVDLRDGKWHHVAFSYSVDTLKLYVDGSEITPTKAVDNTLTNLASPTSFRISNSATGSDMDGMLSDIVVEQAEWSAATVAQIYAGTVPSTAWRFPYGDGVETQQGVAEIAATGTPDPVVVPQGILPTTYGPGALPLLHSLDLSGGESNSPYAQQLAAILADLTYDQGDDDEADALFARVFANYDDRIIATIPALTGANLTDMQEYTS